MIIWASYIIILISLLKSFSDLYLAKKIFKSLSNSLKLFFLCSS